MHMLNCCATIVCLYTDYNSPFKNQSFAVEVDSAKMEMYISTVDPTTATFGNLEDLTSMTSADDYSFTVGDTYYVYCIVKEATPAPAITATLGSSLGAGATTTLFPDMDATAASDVLANIVTAQVFTFLANHASHCGNTLTCTGSNTADDILGSSVDNNDKEGPNALVNGGK